MKQAPADEVAETQKASADPKPFDIFEGVKGEPFQIQGPSQGTPGFDVFAGMKPVAPAGNPTEPRGESAPKREPEGKGGSKSGIYLAIAITALVIGVIIGMMFR
jgi:hypothetical protein